MKNTPENKAKFFAQYWGQEVLITPHLIWEGNPPEPSHEECSEDQLNENNFKQVLKHNFPLWLKPLSQITDEDALVVYRFHWPLQKTDDKELRDSVDTQESVDWLKYHYNEEGYIKLTAEGVDYLRLKGYSVDWFDIPVNQQIEWGWIKLKK